MKEKTTIFYHPTSGSGTEPAPEIEPIQCHQPVAVLREVQEKPVMLVVGDSPTLTTGFARVVQNLVRRWRPHFDRIDIWGIGYSGWPVQGEWRGCDIYPAGWPFQTAARYAGLADLIASGRYTNVWMIQDTFNLVLHDFPKTLVKACQIAKEKTGKAPLTALYFPVDAPMAPAWSEIVEAVDVAVAYTAYGKASAERAIAERARLEKRIATGRAIHILPHGVDTTIYRPLPDRERIRKKIFTDGWAEKDWLLLNVNSNQRRKGLVQTFQVLAALKRIGHPVKAYLHMHPINNDEHTDLQEISRQLGLVPGDDWRHGAKFFASGAAGHGLVGETTMNELYNAADLLITTTLGEGWGLSITEALAAGIHSFVPDNTSCGEIARRLLEMGCGCVHACPCALEGHVNMFDNSRVRYAVDVEKMAEAIGMWFAEGEATQKWGPNAKVWKDWLDWDRIAKEWLDKLGVR